MCLSGYLASKSLESPLPTVIAKRFRQLILPSISFGIVIWGVSILLESEPVPFFGHLRDGFWFLKSAFICYVLYTCSFRIIRNTAAAFAISLLLSQLIGAYQVAYMYPAFLFGTIINDKWQTITNKQSHYLVGASLLFAIGVVCLELGRQNPIPLNALAASAYTRVLRILTGIAGSMFFILLFTTLSKRFGNSSLWGAAAQWGRHTLGIYLLQTVFLEKVLAHFIDCGQMNPLVFNLLFAPALSFILLYACVQTIRFMSRLAVLRKIAFGASK